jgi:hypothetical protein
MADPLTTTLVVMYFVTPPAKLLPHEEKETFEARVPWTLQSTDHIETEDSVHCVVYAKKLMIAVRPVNTVTLRAYCLCPNGDGDKNCYAPTAEKHISAVGGPAPQPTIQAIGPNTPIPSAPPQPKPGTGTEK